MPVTVPIELITRGMVLIVTLNIKSTLKGIIIHRPSAIGITPATRSGEKQNQKEKSKEPNYQQF